MKTKLLLLTLVAVLLIPVAANAISEAAVIFLLIEPGSRAGAMGQAYVAQADDGFASYWNPGALAFNRKSQVASMLPRCEAGVQQSEDRPGHRFQGLSTLRCPSPGLQYTSQLRFGGGVLFWNTASRVYCPSHMARSQRCLAGETHGLGLFLGDFSQLHCQWAWGEL